MPEYTPRFGLPKPLGNENVSRAKHNELVDKIDAITPQMVGAIPTPVLGANKWWFSTGDSAIDLKNSDIVGLNSLVFNDQAEATSIKEGIWFPKTGKAGSLNQDDYDNLALLDGQLLFNRSPISDDGSPKTSKIITIYVSPTGNDSTGTGSNLYPYLTIQRAVDSIPNIHLHDYVISCAPGDYMEEVRIKGLIGGSINIQYNGVAPIAKDTPTGLNVLSITVEDCACYVRIRDVDFFHSEQAKSEAVAMFKRCSYGAIDNCRFDSNTKTTSIYSVLYDASRGNVYSSMFKDQYGCVRAQSSSHMTVSNSNGYAGSILYSINSSSSVVHKVTGGQTPIGTEVKQSGGQIF